MGSITGLVGLANVGMSAYQSYESYRQQKVQAEVDAANLEAQADKLALEADAALRIGELNQAEQRVKGRADIAAQRAEYAASGVKVDQGSTLAVAADKAAWSEYERQKIAYEAELQSWGLNYDAAMLRQDAANARATGKSSGFNWAGTAVKTYNDAISVLKS